MSTGATRQIEAFREWLHQKRWRNRLIIALILIPYLGHFTYTRLTMCPPIDLLKELRPIDIYLGEDDRTAVTRPAKYANENSNTVKFENTINRLLPMAMITPALKPPTGKQWVEYYKWKIMNDHARGGIAIPSQGVTPGTFQLEPGVALKGPWKPTIRLHLQEVLKYLQKPKVTNALDEIIALCAKPINPSDYVEPNVVDQYFMEYRTAAELLIVRGRFFLAEEQNFNKALENIRAALQLCQNLEDERYNNAIEMALEFRKVAARELVCWTNEFELKPDQINQLIQVLNQYSLQSWQTLWKRYTENEKAYSTRLSEGLYVKKANGNGWYVPHLAWENKKPLQVYNLLTPLFADRKSVLQRMAVYYDKLHQAGDLPYPKAKKQIRLIDDAYLQLTDALSHMRNSYSCTCVSDDDLYDPYLGPIVRSDAGHKGKIIMLAIAAYKQTHGTYPLALDELVPQFFSKLPKDPFDEAAFRYRFMDNNKYILYSVGGDGIDDGGDIRNENQQQREELKDLPVHVSRDEDYYGGQEWILVDKPPNLKSATSKLMRSLRQLFRGNLKKKTNVADY